MYAWLGFTPSNSRSSSMSHDWNMWRNITTQESYVRSFLDEIGRHFHFRNISFSLCACNLHKFVSLKHKKARNWRMMCSTKARDKVTIKKKKKKKLLNCWTCA